MRWTMLMLATASLGLSGPAAGRERAPAEWSQAAVDDLHYIRAALRENHPGPFDRGNPEFRQWFEQGFDKSLTMARQAHDYAGYYFAIQYYVVGFQDSHLGALNDDRLSDEIKLERQWPGFVVGLAGGRFMVMDTAGDATAIIGTTLVSCDGRSADALAEQRLKPFLPLWSLRGARSQVAPYLLIDEGNPFVPRPRACTFSDGRRTHRVQLKWRPISTVELAPKIRHAQGQIEASTGIRSFGERGRWITLASFNANTDTDSQPLLDIIKAIEAEPQQFRGADVLVFDVRGNQGGNSEFGKRIAAALWGQSFVESVPKSTAVDWRLSRLNLRQLERSNLPALETRFGKDDPNTRAFREFVDRFRAAFERGELFYREDLPRRDARVGAIPVRAKMFLLTDGWCKSACLDFVDLVLAAPGVAHVGAETSADTVYIDNTGWYLPSGEGSVGWSMKVHRGRPRGHNQSYVPTHVWNGAMSDTAGLERWIRRLAATIR